SPPRWPVGLTVRRSTPMKTALARAPAPGTGAPPGLTEEDTLPPSLLQRLVGQPEEVLAQPHVAGRVQLRHQDADHLVLRTDPEVGLEDPGPRVRARRRALRARERLRPHAEAVAELVTLRPRGQRQLADLVACHLVHRLRLEDAHAVQLAAAQQHA